MKCFTAVLLILAIVLAGCTPELRSQDPEEPGGSQEVTEEAAVGTRETPATAGETVVYDGMDAEDEEFAYKAEITLLSTMRGEQANRILLYTVDYITEEDIPEGWEVLIAKMRVKVLESASNAPLPLEQESAVVFSLHYGDGTMYTNYDAYMAHAYTAGTPQVFGDLKPGEEQTGHIFYFVEKNDKDPLIVCEPTVDDGIWFKTSISEEEQGLHEVNPADWGLAKDPVIDHYIPVPEGNYGGAISAPLPIGAMGLYASGDNKRIEAEITLLEVERGDDALERLIQDSSVATGYLYDDREVMALKFQVHLLTADSGVSLDFASYNFQLASVNGKAVSASRVTTDSLSQLRRMFRGSSQEGWQYFIVDKEEDAFLVSPVPDGTLWFTTDRHGYLGEDYDAYQSRYEDFMAQRLDIHAPVGSMENPAPFETAVSFESTAFMSEHKVEMRVLESVRGEEALYRFKDEYSLVYALDKMMETEDFLCVRVEISLLETGDNGSMSFDTSDFTLVTQEGLGHLKEVGSFYISEEIGSIYPGATVVGDVIFYIGEEEQGFYLTYPRYPVEGPKSIWMDATPENTGTQQSAQESAPGVEAVSVTFTR